MALDAQQVEAMQNSTPTNWGSLDSQLSERSDFDRGRFAADSKLYVKFFVRPKINLDKSNEANRPIYEDCEFVQIMSPGEKNSIIERPVASMRDDLRFPEHYKLFKEGQAEQMVGTPLKVLPFLTEAQVEELAYFKIRTVEALANLSDSVIQNFMGARELQQKAMKFLTASTSGETLAEENRKLREQFTAMQEQMKALLAEKSPKKKAAAAEEMFE